MFFFDKIGFYDNHNRTINTYILHACGCISNQHLLFSYFVSFKWDAHKEISLGRMRIFVATNSKFFFFNGIVLHATNGNIFRTTSAYAEKFIQYITFSDNRTLNGFFENQINQVTRKYNVCIDWWQFILSHMSYLTLLKLCNLSSLYPYPCLCIFICVYAYGCVTHPFCIV